MKYSTLLFISILILSCKKNDNSELMFGTWTKCNEDGKYFEWKIEKNNILMLGIIKDDVVILENKITDNSLIIKGVNVNLPIDIDTLEVIMVNTRKIVLKSSVMGQIIEMNRIKNEIEKIDSTNLENWKSQTILNFKKRAKLFNCLDLRSEEKKKLPVLEIYLDTLVDFEEISIEQFNDSVNQ